MWILRDENFLVLWTKIEKNAKVLVILEVSIVDNSIGNRLNIT